MFLLRFIYHIPDTINYYCNNFPKYLFKYGYASFLMTRIVFVGRKKIRESHKKTKCTFLIQTYRKIVFFVLYSSNSITSVTFLVLGFAIAIFYQKII